MSRYDCEDTDCEEYTNSKDRKTNHFRRTSLRLRREVIAVIVGGALLLTALPASAQESSTGYRWARSLPAGTRIDPNVVYGMYSGLALLMDVYYPANPNGYGIVFIPGSGWAQPLSFDAPSLKESHSQFDGFARPVLAAGYTMFVINVRATPRFHYPDPVEDAQRAVRFVRFHAKRYGIHADRIGALGLSSGANLATMLGVLGGDGKTEDPDPINRESARVQCVVGGATPTNLSESYTGSSATYLAAYIGVPVPEPARKNSAVARKLDEASPLHYVAPDDPPMMFFHGDADMTVPYVSAEEMKAALKRAGVPVKLIRVHGGTHEDVFAPGAPDITAAIVGWFDQYLVNK